MTNNFLGCHWEAVKYFAYFYSRLLRIEDILDNISLMLINSKEEKKLEHLNDLHSVIKPVDSKFDSNTQVYRINCNISILSIFL